MVNAELLAENNQLIFTVTNDMLSPGSLSQGPQRGGIGLVNIKKRLEIYYPQKNKLTLREHNNKYIAELIIYLK